MQMRSYFGYPSYERAHLELLELLGTGVTAGVTAPGRALLGTQMSGIGQLASG
jgi:hypothetical protein